jgi:hypothetical protein
VGWEAESTGVQGDLLDQDFATVIAAVALDNRRQLQQTAASFIDHVVHGGHVQPIMPRHSDSTRHFQREGHDEGVKEQEVSN